MARATSLSAVITKSTVTLGGITLTSAGDHDGLVTKLDSAGTFVWARSLGGSGFDEAYGMSLDASGNLYTSGYFTGTAKFGSLSVTSAGGEDGFVAKFNGSGTFLWVRQLGGSLHDYAGSVQVDSAGNVYTAGDFRHSSIFGYAPSHLRGEVFEHRERFFGSTSSTTVLTDRPARRSRLTVLAASISTPSFRVA